jgi:hypothetical protein
MAEPPKGLRPGDPYCNRCGYALVGLTEASKCPECGTPFVEGLVRGRNAFQGRGTRYTSEARVFGLPVISVAFGPDGDEPTGRARGFVALGNDAVGVFAFGGRCTGVVAMGGLASGGITFGGASIGLVSASGGAALGGLSAGGASAGGIANGGAAIGYIANGGAAVGWYAAGGGAVGKHVISPRRSDPAAQQMFQSLQPLFGQTMGVPNVIVTQVLLGVSASAIIATMAVVALVRHARRTGTGLGKPAA